ncbi:probable G-protein coupled receptor 141 [Tachysurus fulvidraco]|uniref:probable G-protein coupled receptor 141 n=1 Tax=Tachysurus fulvidraco TaxID=1234273 RepID=UPI000F4D309B|nr:probable G-protein coupled receptor 141 [Tachysurus fulvidraco]
MKRPRHQLFALLPLALSIHSSFCFIGTMNLSASSNSTMSSAHQISLIIIYSTVLTVGSVGVTLMIGVLKSNLRSWTTVTFFNLILVHVFFLLTIPFRIYYYVTQSWDLHFFFCKVVSSMIHIHMHVVFVIYVIILTVNFVYYFKKVEQIGFYRSFHAMAFSVAIWSVVLIVGPVTLYHYGAHANKTDHRCFHFGEELKNGPVLACNIFLSVCTIIVSCIMSCVLASILYFMIKKHGAGVWAHQEFWAQMKNVSLVLIILFCLAPYHLYRLYYLTKHSVLQQDNEVFLAFTAITCFDMMFVFAGKGICHRCGG